MLLAVSDEEAIGRPCAETFFADNRFDQLNDLMLNAGALTPPQRQYELLRCRYRRH